MTQTPNSDRDPIPSSNALLTILKMNFYRTDEGYFALMDLRDILRKQIQAIEPLWLDNYREAEDLGYPRFK